MVVGAVAGEGDGGQDQHVLGPGARPELVLGQRGLNLADGGRLVAHVRYDRVQEDIRGVANVLIGVLDVPVGEGNHDRDQGQMLDISSFHFPNIWRFQGGDRN